MKIILKMHTFSLTQLINYIFNYKVFNIIKQTQTHNFLLLLEGLNID
jgi:hypothetical protein